MPRVYTEEFWQTSMFKYIIFISDEIYFNKAFESMIDLFLVYCDVRHYFEKDAVITLFDHAARSVMLNQFD